MNFSALVLLMSLNERSWADYDDEELPPIPLEWLKDAKVHEEWTIVEPKKKRAINSVPLGVRK